MRELIQQIKRWAEARNLIRGSTPQKQMLKLMEEFGELCSGVAKNKPDVIKDSIGDCFVVLVILNEQKKAVSSLDWEVACNTDSWGGSVENGLIYLAKHISALNFDSEPKNYNSLETFNEKLGEFINDFKLAVSYLTYIAYLSELDFKDCVQHAYDEVKDRKGRMIDGFFVKEADLK
ncbi:pyrophosphatase [Aggregatibacter actinomycetemcomitans]|uniref:MazG-like family protein n=1 Tax=Aggregatibacter actinomycetemcomitans TaxID=714 RepID=UPI00197C6447|nr:MazG-like family protein [Aggregatibacter actinomycetemcomitans]MBN6075747.1 pyrophosphatase [Aggregatibacter actinomycetemcomitans]